MTHHGPDIAPAVGLMFLIFAVFIVLIVTVITILAFCKIFSKAGYCWAFGLLALVPFGNLIMILILAFADWPICRELRSLKPQTPGK
jgi:hypothetical protein